MKETEGLRIALIRHGKTAGNLKKRYIGMTDEPLCPQGAEELRRRAYPLAQIWISSPMKRCLETMEMISGGKADSRRAVLFSGNMPETDCCILPDFRECDFGLFENKNYLELSGNPAYQQWIDSNGTLPFPGGESPDLFRRRCCQAFEQVVQWLLGRHYTSANLVVHGGTIMSIMERYAWPQRGYYEWHTKNGEGFLVSLKQEEWRTKRCFSLEEQIGGFLS